MMKVDWEQSTSKLETETQRDKYGRREGGCEKVTEMYS